MIDPVNAFKIVGHALRSPDRPLLAHLVVTRRCNLSCSYCNEYDDASPVVPLEALRERVRDLAALKTLMVACTGGEPLLHPQISEVVREIRRAGMIAMITTNGHLLTEEKISRLNEAGLQALQVSIDNATPSASSSKSLSILDAKLRNLAALAAFPVNINTVLGVGTESAAAALTVAQRAVDLGFSHSIGLVHDHTGAMRALSGTQRAVYWQAGMLSRALLHVFNYAIFQRKLVRGRPRSWNCRAGARYLYVCEDGLVHWCSQQRGRPAIPLTRYGVEHIRREFRTRKACAPLCTVTCVHQASAFDGWRGQQTRHDPIGRQVTASRMKRDRRDVASPRSARYWLFPPAGARCRADGFGRCHRRRPGSSPREVSQMQVKPRHATIPIDCRPG